MTRAKTLAWLVHLYTASGAVISAWAIFAIFAHDYRTAWILITATILIDSTDGILARACRVKEVLPNFDGRRLDDIVDYIGWVLVPILLLVEAGLLPAWAAAAPLLASGYGFAQAEAKTEDHFFLGFPSYWSLLGFILYMFSPAQPIVTAVILFFSVMVFVPVRYPYPTRMTTLRTLTLALSLPWLALGLYQIAILPDRPRWLAILYCFYPTYYVGLTIYFSWQRRQAARTMSPPHVGHTV